MLTNPIYPSAMLAKKEDI